MATQPSSSELNPARPGAGRHAMIAGIVFLVVAFGIATIDRDENPSVKSVTAPYTIVPPATSSSKTTRTDVPAYYFPVEIDTTETYIHSIESDCGASTATRTHDYPKGWLKP